MNITEIRKKSEYVSKKLGYSVNPNLPLIDEPIAIRSTSEILNRILVLHVVCAVNVGIDNKIGLRWINEENLKDSLIESELELLEGRKKPNAYENIQVEGLWALCWVISLVNEMEFDKKCSNDFVFMFPDIKNGENSTEFMKKAIPRDHVEIYQMLDTAYVLHWGLNHIKLKKLPMPGKALPYVIIERRRALEWIITDVQWDEVALDT